MFVVAGRVAELLESFYGPRWGMGLPAWRILAVVADRPGVSAREIARACGLDAVGASRGIASRRPRLRPARGRGAGSALRLGDADGRRGGCLRRDRDPGPAIEVKLLAALPEAERAALDRALDRLDAASGRITGAGWRALLAEAETGR